MENEINIYKIREILQNRNYNALMEIIPSIDSRDAIYYCDEYWDNYEAMMKLISCGKETTSKQEKEYNLLTTLLEKSMEKSITK